MQCDQCGLDRPSHMFINGNSCVSCVYANKTVYMNPVCKTCKKEIKKEDGKTMRRVYCSGDCSKKFHDENRKLYFTRVCGEIFFGTWLH